MKMDNEKPNHAEFHPRRFYCESLAGELVALDMSEAHHLINVVRVKPGQPVELFDGKGGLAIGTVEKAKRCDAIIRITSRRQAPTPSKPNVHLQFAAAKSRRLDWLLEKTAELGASSLQAVIFERSVAGPKLDNELKADKWIAHCVSAAKQSGLNYLPRIIPPQPLNDLLESSPQNALKIFGDLCEDTVTLRAALEGKTPDDICILVGPEGGLSENERALARKAGYIPVRLGDNILRIETAAIALTAGVRAVIE